MKLESLIIASLAVAAIVGCGKQPSPAVSPVTPAASTRGALSQAEIDAYISWSRDFGMGDPPQR
jgi:hypothetical protein